MHTNHIIRSRPFALLVCSLATLVPLSGCFSYQRAQGEPLPAEATAPDAWPVFETSPELRELMDTPEVIERYVFDVERLPSIWQENESDLEVMRRFHTQELVLSNLDDHGLLRVWRDQRQHTNNALPGPSDQKPRSFDRNGRYLTTPILEWKQREREIETMYGGGRGMSLPSRSIYGLPKSDFDAVWKLHEGLEVAVPESVGDDPKGLVIHITGMFETKYEQSLTNRLRSYGFVAAYIQSDPFLRSPREEERAIQSAQNEKHFYELMDESLGEAGESLTDFEKHIQLSADEVIALSEKAREAYPPVRGFAIYPDTDLVEYGRVIAELSDELLATHAYAAEALVRASEQQHPSLKGKPIIVIGYSAGALSAPATTARLVNAYPERPIRLILVGGGGDLITLASQSTLGDMVMNFTPYDGPEPSEAQLSELSSAYLTHSRLDPLVLAPALRSVPTLHIYAKKDNAVPTAAAERFNEAHGHVDRLVHRWNHGTLFYFMSGQAGKIRSWLRDHGVE